MKRSLTRMVDSLTNATFLPSGDSVGYWKLSELESGAARHRFFPVATLNATIPMEAPPAQKSEKRRDWPSGVHTAPVIPQSQATSVTLCSGPPSAGMV